MKSWRFSIVKKYPTSYKMRNSRKLVMFIANHDTVLQAMEVTYCAQLRISGKVEIKLIAAEIPFMTNISTNNQSWLQESLGEKLTFKETAKLHAKEGRQDLRQVRFTDDMTSLVLTPFWSHFVQWKHLLTPCAFEGGQRSISPAIPISLVTHVTCPESTCLLITM